MRGENDCAALSERGYLRDDGPHEALCLRVHSRRGLIEEDDRRVTNKCHCDRELSLVATTKFFSTNVAEVLQVHLLDLALDDLVSQFRYNALDSSVEPQVLVNGHAEEDRVELWAVANHLACSFKVFNVRDIQPSDVN